MRIIQISSLKQSGGAESFICYLSNELVEHNEVEVCSIFQPENDSPYYNMLEPKVKKTHLGIQKNGFSIKNLFLILSYLYKCNADIIHFHGFFYYYVIPIIILHNRVKFVFTLHSDAYKENQKWDKRIFFLKKLLMKIKWVNPVTISPQSRQSFKNLYGFDSHMIINGVKSYNIVDGQSQDLIERYKLNENTKVFFHPGRISEPKNQITLCRVFRRLINDGRDVVLLIAGAIQDENIYQEMTLYLSDRIIYMGERNDVSLLLSVSDGMCLPSLWEGLPLVLLEALSVGCIPLCAPVGGIVSVITDGKNGLLSKSSSEEDYYATMNRFLDSEKAEIELMHENCKVSFSNYDIKNTAKNYYHYYCQILKR